MGKDVHGRRIRGGMVGGAQGAFIGPVHRRAATMDGEAEFVAGCFSRDPAKSRQAVEALHLDPARVYASHLEMAAREAERPAAERRDSRLFFAPHFVDNRFFGEASENAKRTGKTTEIRLAAGIPVDAFVLLFLGKLIPIKRAVDFVQACLRVMALPEGRNVHALLVGDGPLRKDLEQQAKVNADRIHFAGFRNQSELPAYYAASDALVLPSEAETWGLVVNEAFACGIPAVVSDACGCAPDLIEDGRTGYTFSVGDVDSLSQRMLTLNGLCENKAGMLPELLAKKTSLYSIELATHGLARALDIVVTIRYKRL